MYARKVSLCLKTESASKFLEKIEHEVVPLLRKQKGFLDQLTILSDSGEIIYGGAAVSGRDVWSVGTYRTARALFRRLPNTGMDRIGASSRPPKVRFVTTAIERSASNS
jgi:hypothetical protein